jgi:retron-type reverse transcriptase
MDDPEAPVGWRDTLRRIFGRPSESVQSGPEPPGAAAMDLPVEPLSPSPSRLPPGPDVPRGEALETPIKPVSPDLEGLKEHHRRRAIRDPRLAPKTRGKRLPLWLVGLFGFRTSASAAGRFEAGEVRRLCSPTMRTRNRRIRDLLADEDQLSRHGLPIWRSEDDVAAALGISPKQLRSFATHRAASAYTHYVSFTIPRRSGGHRVILAPKRALKQAQRTLLDLLVRKLPVSEHAHGFRAGRSIATGAAPHVGRGVVLAMDLKDFFPSVTFARVRGFLIALGYGYRVATTLAVLMTEAERQETMIKETMYHVSTGPRYCVQGAPTSPGLCNALALRLDRRLAGLAGSFGFSYTRYADDLSFSGNDVGRVPALRQMATRIIEEEGFRINEAKTRIMRRGRRQTVTGVVVNDVPGLSRRERRRIRAMIHQTDPAAADPAPLAWLRGKLAYLNMLNPEQAAALRAGLGRARGRSERSIQGPEREDGGDEAGRT